MRCQREAEALEQKGKRGGGAGRLRRHGLWRARPWRCGEEDRPPQPLTSTTAATRGRKRRSLTRRNCWLEELKKEARVEGHVAGGAAAALGGESSRGASKWRGRRRRQDGVWSGVACARSDSLEGRARPVGAGRPVVPRGVLAGAWPPRGVHALARSKRGRSARAGEREARRGSRPGRLRELG